MTFKKRKQEFSAAHVVQPRTRRASRFQEKARLSNLVVKSGCNKRPARHKRIQWYDVSGTDRSFGAVSYC